MAEGSARVGVPVPAHIVPGTGTGAFAGWTGSARIVHDNQGAYFEINLA
jgi:hypothetical protein